MKKLLVLVMLLLGSVAHAQDFRGWTLEEGPHVSINQKFFVDSRGVENYVIEYAITPGHAGWIQYAKDKAKGLLHRGIETHAGIQADIYQNPTQTMFVFFHKDEIGRIVRFSVMFSDK